VWPDALLRVIHERDAARAEATPLRAALDALLAEHVLADGEDWCRACGTHNDLSNWPCGVVHTIRQHVPLRPAEGAHVHWMSDEPSAFTREVDPP
jgi:hypothetical protein